MKILFSPVGNTDPFFKKQGDFLYSDGSMIHICRNYMPEKIYLYMSKDITEYEEYDHRFTKALKYFYLKAGKTATITVTNNNRFGNYVDNLNDGKIHIVVLENEKLSDPQDFNFFYCEYEKLIGMIMEKVDENDELLFNVSSGTPAMKSALIVLRNLKQYENCTLIQVDSPDKHGRDSIKEYDVDTAWKINNEKRKMANEEENNISLYRGYVENRCREIECNDFERIQMENVVKKLIDKYDYSAALDIVDSGIFSKNKSRKCRNLLGMASKRLILDIDTSMKTANSCNLDFFPMVKDKTDLLYIEYYLILQIKIEQEQYVDFTRGMTPLFVNLLELILLDYYDVNLDNLTRKDANRRKWDLDKISNDLNSAFEEHYNGNKFHGGDISSDHLSVLLDVSANENNKKEKELLEDVKTIRRFEEVSRNKFAHRMEPVKSTGIEKEAKKIAERLRRLFDYTHFTEYDWWTSGVQWKSYEKMNELIKKRIK